MGQKFDAIIIGTGQSGPSLAKALCKEGWKVAILEKDKFGGTCVNNGCTPTKTLVANAKIVQSVRIANDYGIEVDHFHINYRKVKERKDKFVHESSSWVENSLRETPNCTVIKGEGIFEGPHEVKVNGQVIEGDKIFINVGGRSSVPSIPGLQQIPYLTSKTLLDLEYIPEHLLILGGGYIALEFAQIFRRFGSRVTVIQRNEFLMPKEDKDVSLAIKEILSKEGITIETNAANFQILPGSKAGTISTQFEQNGQTKKVQGTDFLIAIGRIPNTDKLGLDKAGVKVDEKGFIEVNDQLQTSQPHIWAIGDCNGKGAFTHTSYNDYEIVRDNLLRNGNRKVSDRIMIYSLFTDPPLGRVGLTEKEALKKYPKLLCSRLPMSHVPRAREKGETEGFLKILVNGENDQILGAAFLGSSGDEVVQAIAVAMYAKAPCRLLHQIVFIHPTISEMIPSLVANLSPVNAPQPVSRNPLGMAI